MQYNEQICLVTSFFEHSLTVAGSILDSVCTWGTHTWVFLNLGDFGKRNL